MPVTICILLYLVAKYMDAIGPNHVTWGSLNRAIAQVKVAAGQKMLSCPTHLINIYVVCDMLIYRPTPFPGRIVWEAPKRDF